MMFPAGGEVEALREGRELAECWVFVVEERNCAFLGGDRGEHWDCLVF